jgi:hypothetical protein
MFVNGSKRNEQSLRGLSIDASYQVHFLWPSGFRWKAFLEIEQLVKEIAYGGHFVNGSKRNEQTL